MLYKSKDKYYVKVSGYLIEVIPSLTNDEIDFKPTENKIEITPDILYKSIGVEEIKKEILDNKTNKTQVSENNSLKSRKMSERTHKYKFDYED